MKHRHKDKHVPLRIHIKHFTQNSHNDPNKSSASPTSKFDLSPLFINTSKVNFAGGLLAHMTPVPIRSALSYSELCS